MGPGGFKEFMRDPCLEWLAAAGANTAWGVLAVENGTKEPMATDEAAGLLFNSCTFTTWGTFFKVDSVRVLTAGV